MKATRGEQSQSDIIRSLSREQHEDKLHSFSATSKRAASSIPQLEVKFGDISRRARRIFAIESGTLPEYSGVGADIYREKYRHKQVTLEESVPILADGPAQKVESILTNEDLRQAITKLTEEQQENIALRFGYEMSIRDVAETTGKSEGAVKMLHAHTIAALSRRIQSGNVNEWMNV